MQDGRIQIVNRQNILDGLESQFVSNSMTDSRLYSGPGENGREAIRIVVAAKRAFLKHGHATKLRTPDDNRVFK